MAKKALLVGCNYPGQGTNELQGCCNDARRMLTVLTSRFGFDEANIDILVDDDESSVQPSHVNIREYLKKLTRDVERGDVLVFFFSGHGIIIEPEAGRPVDASDNTGVDEAIMPTDMSPLTDDDFRDIVSDIPAGVKFTFISDSCHSGGLIDEVKEQIGDAEERYEQEQEESGHQGTPKEISVQRLSLLLSEKLREKYHDTECSQYQVQVGNIRTALFDLFEDDASLTIKTFENLVWQQINEEEDEAGLVGTVSQLSMEFLQARLADRNEDDYLAPAKSAGVYRPRPRRTASRADNVGILLTGCQSYELSQDNAEDRANAYGEFTKAIETVLSRSEMPLTNREMIVEVRKVLALKNLEQHPCLYCSDDNADEVFICEYSDV